VFLDAPVHQIDETRRGKPRLDPLPACELPKEYRSHIRQKCAQCIFAGQVVRLVGEITDRL